MEETAATPELECLVCHTHFAANLSACPRCGAGIRLRTLDYLEKLVTGHTEEGVEETQEVATADAEKESETPKKGGLLKRGKR
jgi:hypothetical protein